MKRILLVLPVYNEETVLAKSVDKLVAYMSRNIEGDWNILIADNASADSTGRIAKALTGKHKNVKYTFIKEKGRGNALRHCWTTHKADVYAYCDIDLSTEISGLKRLFNAVLEGNDIAIGNRYMKGSKTSRSIGRLALSKGYNALVRMFFRTAITDFQCGFKAVSKRVVKEIIPRTTSTNWFFDTEFLIIGENEHRYNIVQIPVTWTEDAGFKDVRKSKVNKLDTILEYIGWLSALKRRIRTESTRPPR